MPEGLPLAAFAALVAWAFSPLIRRVAVRVEAVSQPRPDRWRGEPIPLLGGVAVAGATAIALAAWGYGGRLELALLASGGTMLVVGLVDDRVGLGPTLKLVGSLAAGAALLFLLSQSARYTPPAPAIVLAVVWFAAVLHGVNLIDNIDGLAAGVCAIAALGVAAVLAEYGMNEPAAVSMALGGALLGFLPWNVHPAKLFLGDSGSLFVGAVLAGCTLVPLFAPPAGRPLWPLALGVALIVPLADAVFVSALRWMAGRRPTRGGVDHLSHRLVSIGLSERRSALVLYLVALAAALVAAGIARVGAGALPVVAIFFVGIVLGAIYLAHVPAYAGEDFAALRAPIGSALQAAVIRSHAGQVLLDVVLITVCYYLAYRLRFEGEALEIFLPSFSASLPVVLLCKLAGHYASGLYQRSWFAFGVSDVAAGIRAVGFGSVASVLAVTYLYRFERFSRGVFIIDAILLFLAIVGSRMSFRVFTHAAAAQNRRARRVLICGAQERGQLLARELLANGGWCLRPVGFVDERPPAARSLAGARVWGGLDGLAEVLRRGRVEEVLLSGDRLDPTARRRVLEVCSQAGIPVRELVLEIRDVSSTTSGSSAA
ncbi:MAG TPA: hypothetical protein VNI83_11195 [Vicinamibacterales bacterium]|nr:hypothetical protein [Vicinamibacterales bacterium]